MIKKLRMKFIALSMAALFILLTMILSGINIINYKTVVSEADDTLYLLARNKGDFPNMDNKIPAPMPRGISPETPYESRYFSVLLDKQNHIIQTDTGKIKSVDTDLAMDYASQVISSNKTQGFIENYRFVSFSEDNGSTRITFLDCRLKIHSFRTFLLVSFAMALIGYLLFFFFILFFSGKIIRPVAESYEKQKRFITDAGHEIKTPLTIIRADIDVLEMDCEENEWLQDIKKQTDRLTALTNDLVYLARMEEEDNTIPKFEFPFSDVVYEAASSFQALAQIQEKEFICHIQPMLTFTGNDKAIHQLVGILLDNALKYSPKNGRITLTVEKHNRSLMLSVYNTTVNPVNKSELPLIFERFYRMDPSRDSKSGGYGIGLSVAKAIVSAHKGKILADTADEHSLQITVIFPS